MTDKQIIIDDYFTERTDEGRGTIGYYLFDDTALIKKIREQNEYIKAKEQECETQQKALELQKSFLDHSEWKLKRAEQKLEKIKEHLATFSYLAPATTRYLKHTIKQIIEE